MSFLALHLQDYGSNPHRGHYMDWVFFQSIQKHVVVVFLILSYFHPTSKNWNFLPCLLSMGFLASKVYKFTFLRVIGFHNQNKWNGWRRKKMQIDIMYPVPLQTVAMLFANSCILVWKQNQFLLSVIKWKSYLENIRSVNFENKYCVWVLKHHQKAISLQFWPI